MKKPSKQKIKLYDTLFQDAVTRRDGRCVRCQSMDGLAAHHIIPRRYLSSRWLLENGLTFCIHCHIPWAHKNKLLVERMAINYFIMLNYFKNEEHYQRFKSWTLTRNKFEIASEQNITNCTVSLILPSLI